ncbi:hypothetical protein BYT27DRAFT_7196476, partial [Phlegmacium glaucopus]
MFSLSSNINFVSSSCSSSKSLRSSVLFFILPFRNQDTLGAGRHSTYAEANVLSGLLFRFR